MKKGNQKFSENFKQQIVSLFHAGKTALELTSEYYLLFPYIIK